MIRLIAVAFFIEVLNMKTIRAAVYCRVSSNKRIQMHSVEAQQEYYIDYFKRNSQYTCVGIYTDIASGLNISSRKGFQKMINDCKRGKIDIIITKSISRFSRNTYDFLVVIRTLKKLGIDVFFQNENIYLSEQKGEFMMTVFEAVAQQESVNKSNHIKWGLEAGYRSGSSGLAKRICYGYKKDESGELMICPEQAENVQLIYELYLSGYSLSGIAKELKQRGIDSPTGKETWTSCAIDKILSNEKYTGDVLLQKTFRRDIFSGKQIQNHGEHAQYLYENNHGGIITHEMFERVQMEKQRRSNRCSDNGGMRRKNTRFSQGNTLSGIIRCEECGRNFRRIKTRKGEIFWQCAGQVEHTSDCHAMKLNQTEINDFLEREFGNDFRKNLYSDIEKISVNAEGFQCIMKTEENWHA